VTENCVDREISWVFTCRAYHGRGLLMSRVRVLISREAVECRFEQLPGFNSNDPALVHRQNEIDVFRARIAIPPGVTIRLVGEDGKKLYLWPFYRWPRVRAALVDAGFTLRQQQTWLVAAGRLWSPH
jgi:hypothetical protein